VPDRNPPSSSCPQTTPIAAVPNKGNARQPAHRRAGNTAVMVDRLGTSSATLALGAAALGRPGRGHQAAPDRPARGDPPRCRPRSCGLPPSRRAGRAAPAADQPHHHPDHHRSSSRRPAVALVLVIEPANAAMSKPRPRHPVTWVTAPPRSHAQPSYQPTKARVTLTGRLDRNARFNPTRPETRGFPDGRTHLATRRPRTPRGSAHASVAPVAPNRPPTLDPAPPPSPARTSPRLSPALSPPPTPDAGGPHAHNHALARASTPARARTLAEQKPRRPAR
jgi:hypothetical protein